MAHLPITILSEAIEGGFDLGAFEGAQCGDRATSKCGLAGRRGQDHGKPARVTQRGQGGDGLFENEGIGGRRGDRQHIVDGAGVVDAADGFLLDREIVVLRRLNLDGRKLRVGEIDAVFLYSGRGCARAVSAR